MQDIFLTFFVIIGMGTVGVAIRDVWHSFNARLSAGRRKEDMKQLRNHYETLEAEWDELGRAQEKVAKAKERSQ